MWETGWFGQREEWRKVGSDRKNSGTYLDGDVSDFGGRTQTRASHWKFLHLLFCSFCFVFFKPNIRLSHIFSLPKKSSSNNLGVNKKKKKLLLISVTEHLSATFYCLNTDWHFLSSSHWNFGISHSLFKLGANRFCDFDITSYFNSPKTKNFC